MARKLHNLSEQEIKDAIAAGKPLRVRYEGPDNGLIVGKADGLSREYHFIDLDGHELTIAPGDLKADLPAFATMPGREFAIVGDDEPEAKRRR